MAMRPMSEMTMPSPNRAAYVRAYLRAHIQGLKRTLLLLPQGGVRREVVRALGVHLCAELVATLSWESLISAACFRDKAEWEERSPKVQPPAPAEVSRTQPRRMKGSTRGLGWPEP